MSGIDEILEYPTISKISRQEKNQYQMSHINIMDLLRRINTLEQQAGEFKKSELEFKQEINRLKTTCDELEGRIQKYEANKQSISEVVQKTTIPVNEQKKTVKIGEIIKFGRYEGKEIEWQVLDINQKENSVLLISKYVLFQKAYNDKRIGCTWENSTLRNYLNNDFYRDTFNEEEKKKIKEEIVKNPDNKICGTKGGNDTKDKIFLLSIDEVNKYFKTDEDRKAIFTDGESEWYWLRSPGLDTSLAACVHCVGLVYENGSVVDDDGLGVRSALWVNL